MKKQNHLTKKSFIQDYKNSPKQKFLLDCRNLDETAMGILPEAIVIPLPELAARAEEIPHDAQVFIYCRSGNRAKMAADILEKSGRHDLSVAIECGYSELKNEI